MENNPGAVLPPGEENEGSEEQQVMVLKKGPWTAAEDAMLINHVRQHGEGNWNAVHKLSGLLRSGKSCRNRWINHLCPDRKRGYFTPDEKILIAKLHAQLGNKWAVMAAHLPGRTDKEIKNYWNTRTKRRLRAGLPVYPSDAQLQLALATGCRYGQLSPLAPPQQLLFESSVQTLETAGATSSVPVGPRVELPSNQFMQELAMPPSPAPGADGIGIPLDEADAASLERILQELHEAINVEPPANGGAGELVPERHDGRGGEPEGELMDDIDIDLPLDGAEHAPVAHAPDHSGSISQQNRGYQDPSNGDLVVDLPAAGAASSPDQEWSLDDVWQWTNGAASLPDQEWSLDSVCQWTNGAASSPDQEWNLDGVCQWTNGAASLPNQEWSLDGACRWTNGTASSPDQEWSLDGVCQWTNVEASPPNQA